MKSRHLLDLFCCEGGAARGYQQAGFIVHGVDIEPQPDYVGDYFYQADALKFPLGRFDAIHASPPCQDYSNMSNRYGSMSPRLIAPVRERLEAAGVPWVIENVEDAPLGQRYPCAVLCGYALGLPLYRHRKFESPVLFLVPPHRRHPVVISPGRLLNARYSRAPAGVAGVFPTAAGHTSGGSTQAVAEAMGVPWMTRDEMTQAVPPAYTRLIGTQLRRYLDG